MVVSDSAFGSVVTFWFSTSLLISTLIFLGLPGPLLTSWLYFGISSIIAEFFLGWAMLEMCCCHAESPLTFLSLPWGFFKLTMWLLNAELYVSNFGLPFFFLTSGFVEATTIFLGLPGGLLTIGSADSSTIFLGLPGGLLTTGSVEISTSLVGLTCCLNSSSSYSATTLFFLGLSTGLLASGSTIRFSRVGLLSVAYYASKYWSIVDTTRLALGGLPLRRLTFSITNVWSFSFYSNDVENDLLISWFELDIIEKFKGVAP